MEEATPLLGSADVVQLPPDVVQLPPACTLTFYWPCLLAGVLANTLAVCASTALTKTILDDPTRAAYYESHWWIVWLVGLLLLMVALPVYIFTAIMLSVARSLLGPRGAFPSWMFLILLSCANGLVFYGLFNATYPFSFFLQVQVYSVCAAFGLCAYAVIAFVCQCVPSVGGFNSLGAWLFCAASAIVAYTHMADVFAYLGYPESRTPGAGLWHPWVAFVLQLLFISTGVIQNVISTAEAARFFEPQRSPPTTIKIKVRV